MGILPAMLIWSMASAQFYGWPSPSGSLDPAHDVNSSGVSTLTVASNTTVYADNNRVRVTAATDLGNDEWMLTVSAPAGATSLSLLDFPMDKWCLLIQMEDPSSTFSVGKSTRLEVISYDPILGEIHMKVPPTLVTPGQFNYAALSRVQLIRVPVYRNLYLEPRGELTCHPYNHADGTGGVLPIVVSYKVYFNGGIVNASGKGYHVGGSYTLGQGTAGAPASASPTPAGGGSGYPPGPFPYANEQAHGWGSPQPVTMNPNDNGYLCSADPSASASDFDLSNQVGAQPGYDNNDNTTSVNLTTGPIETYDPISPTQSSAWSTIRMGDAGLPGSYGATGGGGGGFGGQGGMNNSSNSPLSGDIGMPGYGGGAAGGAARGGGIILFKLYTFTVSSSLSSTQKFILSNGEHGHPGGRGGAGGDGGDGGDGADGGCNGSLIVPPGQIGGFGQSGTGGDGADGGDAGESGSIWLMKKNPNALGSRVSLRGGFGGPGGRGGYSKAYYTLPLAENWGASGLRGLSCNAQREYEFCPPQPPCPPIETCDCEKVFEQIERINTPGIQNTNMPYELSATGMASVFYTNDYYTNGTHALYFIDNTTNPCPTTYKCVMYRQAVFTKMLEKLFKKKDLESYIGSPADVGFNHFYDPTFPSNIVNLDYVAAGSRWKGLQFTGGYLDQLQDLDDPSKPIAYGSNCDYSYSYQSATSTGGGSSGGGEPPVKKKAQVKDVKTGTDGDNGADGDNNDTDAGWFVESGSAPAPKDDRGGKYLETTELVSLTQHGIDAYTKEVVLDDKSIPASYALIDMQGKVVAEGTIETSIRLPHLARGTYVLQVTQGKAVDIRKIQL